MKMLRLLLWITLAAAAIGAPSYYALLLHSPAPSGEFSLDIAAIRTLANSIPGSKATEIRYEEVAALEFSEALQMAGDPWQAIAMPVYAYQLVFPEQTLIVDTAEDRATAKPDALILRFDQQAYDRVSRAMEQAAQIVVTHEHLDHIGGIVAHPHLQKILPALRLTEEQVGNTGGTSVGHLPGEVLKNYQALRYERLLAIAPGVVLIKSPGHTPGSQMVYVQRADGRELLFLGDVSWRLRNIENVRERPLLMTWVIGEDRPAVLGQFLALHALHQSEGGLAMVPGHEGPAVKALASAGLLQAGFR